MITDGKPFDTNVFFSGGAGMFVQYHDVIKPVYLYAIVKMIATRQTFGLPINIIESMSLISIIEWYINRRFINPFKCLDYNHCLPDEALDAMLWGYLLHDDSIYSLSPCLNFLQLMSVYKSQQMSFPIYVYSKNEEPYIETDCNNIFGGIKVKYMHGDLKEAIKKCDQNFTYIFSDIELVKESAEILTGTCSNILLARDYRYNYTDYSKTFKYDLLTLMREHPFTRIGTTEAVDMVGLFKSFLRKEEVEN